MLPFLRSLLLAVIALSSSLVYAAPLGTIPTIEESNWLFNFSFKSDMWSQFDQAKNEPVRIYDIEFKMPIYKTDTWVASLSLDDESLSLGRTDIPLGDKRVFVGSHLSAQNVGLGFRKDCVNGSDLSIFTSYNSASESSIFEARKRWIEAIAIYHTRLLDHQWMFAIHQSENRGFLNGYPVPYFGITLTDTPEYKSTYGFLFVLLTWEQSNGWKKEFRITPFDSSFRVEKPLDQIFTYSAKVFYNIRSYLHNESTDKNLRLYYQEASIDNSVTVGVNNSTSMIYTLGYTFDRTVYESTTIYRPNTKMYRFKNDFYLMAKLDFKL